MEFISLLFILAMGIHWLNLQGQRKRTAPSENFSNFATKSNFSRKGKRFYDFPMRNLKSETGFQCNWGGVAI